VYSPQVCYWRSLESEKLQPTSLYCWMNTADFKRQIDAVAGQTDMAPYVSLQDQRRIKVPTFPDSQHEIALCLTPLLSKQSLNRAESRTLVTLRDTLLPKLLSGEIRLKDAEKTVGAAI
jgi:type I restriction enzyme S subunit